MAETWLGSGVTVYASLDTDGILNFPKQSCTRMYLNTDQDVPSGAYTKVEFDAESFDVQSEGDTTNHRFKAKVAGYYQVDSVLRFKEAVGDNKRITMAIYKNGAIYSKASTHGCNLTSMGMSIADIVPLDTDDYVQIYVYHDHGTNRQLDGAVDTCLMSVHKLS